MGGVSINMTPMIDIVFLLIIFFLVSSHLAKKENEQKVELPTASSGIDEQQEKTTLTIHVDAEGSPIALGDPIDLPALQNLVAQRVAEIGPTLRVRIRADRHAPYQHVAPLLKRIAQAGASDVVLAVLDDRTTKTQ